MNNRIITFITDFGTRDAYVGVMKGVILRINPDVHIVDLSHEIEPQNVAQAAYVLSAAWHYFPNETIHVIVVDPGVGCSRKVIIAKTAHAYFVAPDNGVLEYIYEDALEAYSVTNPGFRLPQVSNTFHGRDVFAPAAAHLSLGTPMQDFGQKELSFVRLPRARSEICPDGSIQGQIIHIDRFGNLVTNIRSDDICSDDVQIEINDYCISGLCSSYMEKEGILAIIGSDGNLEIALKNGSAADFLGATSGDYIKIGSTSLKT